MGDNATGLVSSGGKVVGGENATLAAGVLPGQDVVFFGAGTTASSIIAPSATIASWNQFIATATATSSDGLVAATLSWPFMAACITVGWTVLG